MTNIPAPMLSNPPAFLLLTLVFAIAAYLRQVSENAIKLRNEIRNGNWSSVYPLAALHTQEKLRLLEKTRDKLGKAAPWTIALAIFIGLRCLAQAISLLCAGYVVATTGWIDLAERWVDIGIVLWLSIMLFILAVMHNKNRSDDAFVRRLEELARQAKYEPTATVPEE